MNPMMFPKMLTSHGEGWDWLMRIHPSVAKTYLFYVLPMSLIPPAMLLYAWNTYGGPPLPEITRNEALFLATVFLVAELVMVPIMGRVLQMIGQVADSYPSYQNAFTLDEQRDRDDDKAGKQIRGAHRGRLAGDYHRPAHHDHGLYHGQDKDQQGQFQFRQRHTLHA